MPNMQEFAAQFAQTALSENTQTKVSLIEAAHHNDQTRVGVFNSMLGVEGRGAEVQSELHALMTEQAEAIAKARELSMQFQQKVQEYLGELGVYVAVMEPMSYPPAV